MWSRLPSPWWCVVMDCAPPPPHGRDVGAETRFRRLRQHAEFVRRPSPSPPLCSAPRSFARPIPEEGVGLGRRLLLGGLSGLGGLGRGLAGVLLLLHLLGGGLALGGGGGDLLGLLLGGGLQSRRKGEARVSTVVQCMAAWYVFPICSSHQQQQQQRATDATTNPIRNNSPTCRWSVTKGRNEVVSVYVCLP